MVAIQSETEQRIPAVKIISNDIAISYKLLRFLDSAYFYRLQRVKTVKHAIAYLGETELRRFILLILV